MKQYIFAIAAASCLSVASGQVTLTWAGNTLKQAKLIIEHNATDNDTGFQVFLDADGWKKLEIIGPDGAIANFQPGGGLNDLGMTELFFESVEPENAKVPLEVLLKRLPEGDYIFRAFASKLGGGSGVMTSHATLSHKIPEGVTLLSPKNDAVVPLDDTLLRWQESTKAVNGSNLKIIAYQVIVEKDEEPHPRMIGKRGLSLYLPASVNEIKLPQEFLEPATSYLWEVLAIEEGGNQTLQSGAFKTK